MLSIVTAVIWVIEDMGKVNGTIVSDGCAITKRMSRKAVEGLEEISVSCKYEVGNFGRRDNYVFYL